MPLPDSRALVESKPVGIYLDPGGTPAAEGKAAFRRKSSSRESAGFAAQRSYALDEGPDGRRALVA